MIGLSIFNSAKSTLYSIRFISVTSYMLHFYSICILHNSRWDYGISSNPSDTNIFQVVIITANRFVTFQEKLQLGMELHFCQGFVVFEEEIIAFLKAYSYLSLRIARRVSRYHFIFVVKDLNGVLKKTSGYDVFVEAPDIIFVEQHNESMYNIWTTNFVRPFTSSSVIFLDTYDGYNNRFQNGCNLFPNKLANLKQRPLRVGTFTYKPYVVITDPPKGENSNMIPMKGSSYNGTYLDGTEGRLLVEFCKKFNCTLHLLGDDASEWGEVNSNFTGIGMFGDLVMKRVDVIVNAIYMWHYNYYQYSVGLSRSGVTCLVPEPKRIVSWLLPFEPLSLRIWMAMLAILLQATAALTTFYHYFHPNENDSSLLRGVSTLLRISLSQSISFIPARVSERFLFMCCLLNGFILNIIYGGGLSSILTIPNFEENIDTKEQLALRGLAWTATTDAWIYSIQDSSDYTMRKLVSNFCVHTKEELLDLSLTGHYGFALERLPYGHFAVADYITIDSMNNLQIMLHDIYSGYCVLAAFKTWPLMDYFNEFILRLQQSGIQSYIEQDVVKQYADLQLQIQIARKRKNAIGTDPRILTIQDILGVLVLWTIGIVSSVLLFSSEIVSHIVQQ